MSKNMKPDIPDENRAKKLSPSDLTLLSELEEDAKQPLSQLAKKLKISQQLLSYRLQLLKRKKILGGFYTKINFPMLGYTKYRTLIRLSNYSKKKEQEILEYLMRHSNVQWVVECGGKWDFLVNFIAKNIIQYDNFLKDFKNKFPRQIQNFDIFIVIEFSEFGRAYFTKAHRKLKKISHFGRDFKQVKIDRRDLQILDLLSENARITSVEIAEKIGVSPNTVSSRIRNLQNKGVILAFKPLIHLENTGFMAYKLPVKFQNCTEEIEKEIIEYLKSDVRVAAIVKLTGQWDFEIEFEVDSRQSMLDFTRGFRDKFSNIIREFELIPLYHEYKYNYFPRDMVGS